MGNKGTKASEKKSNYATKGSNGKAYITGNMDERRQRIDLLISGYIHGWNRKYAKETNKIPRDLIQQIIEYYQLPEIKFDRKIVEKNMSSEKK